jgi:hypothetical protein
MAEESFGPRESLDVRCPACHRTIHIVSPRLQTLRVGTTRKSAAPLREEISPEGRLLHLPGDQALSLKVLEGAEKGTVYPLTKPRTLIGRTNADVRVDDRLVSRLHCAVEVGDGGVILRDLGSTNGTHVNDQPIAAVNLVGGSTFRIGEHVFQLEISPKPA